MELLGSQNNPGIHHGCLIHQEDTALIQREQDFGYVCPSGFSSVTVLPLVRWPPCRPGKEDR